MDYRMLGHECPSPPRPPENEAFDQVFKKEVDAWAQEEEETSKADVGNVELEKEFTEDDAEACVNKLQCHKAAGANGIVNELMKFGGKGMIQLMVLLYNWVWKNENAPRNYRRITPFNTGGKVFCKLLNDRIVGVSDNEQSISEGQAGFRKKRGCEDHAFRVGRIIQGRRTAGKPTYCFFLDVKKAYHTVWRGGLWKQLSKYGIKGKMWRVLKKMTEWTLKLRCRECCLRMMSDTAEGLQLHIDAAEKVTDTWRLSANVQKSAVMLCNENKEEPVEHRWKWGIEEIAVVDQYTYLGVEIAKDCSWNAHMSKVAEKGKARAGKLHPILANRHLDTRSKLKILKIAIAKWANKKRGRQPTEWVKLVEDEWKAFDIDEDETLETEGLQGFKEKISVACAEREEQNLRKESKDKEGLEVYGMLKEGIGFKDYLHGPMDAGTKLKVKFRTGDIGLRERRRRHRTVDEEDDEIKCACGSECDDRVHVVTECPLYKKEREVYVTELGKI
ncbi:unnamed protein product [Ectocarpus sp. CCAP 1310/34]|nr:unnamed protein product [Ectocarpus sp. CCAP 1310/34]